MPLKWYYNRKNNVIGDFERVGTRVVLTSRSFPLGVFRNRDEIDNVKKALSKHHFQNMENLSCVLEIPIFAKSSLEDRHSDNKRVLATLDTSISGIFYNMDDAKEFINEAVAHEDITYVTSCEEIIFMSNVPARVHQRDGDLADKRIHCCQAINEEHDSAEQFSPRLLCSNVAVGKYATYRDVYNNREPWLCEKHREKLPVKKEIEAISIFSKEDQ